MNSKYLCEKCGCKFSIQSGCLKKRKEQANKPICVSCYKEISKGGRYGKSYYPKELQKYWGEDEWDYETVLPYIKNIKTKKKVKFKCEVCSKKDSISINKMRRRKICGIRPICRKCASKFATSSEQWISNNSEAQKIAQNRPEVLKKQRDAQIKLMKSDPLYAEKRCSKSYISGKIRGEKFDSSWELYFLVYCWKSKKVESISRYNGSVEYVDVNNRKRRYYPDFVVEYVDGKSIVVEIKGSKKYNNFHEKFNAAKKNFKSGYIVLEEKDLEKLGICFRKKSYLKSFYKEHINEIEFYKNPKTKTFIKRIKQWLQE